MSDVSDTDRDALIRLLEDHDKEADESGQFTAEIDFGCCADAILDSAWLAEHDAAIWQEGAEAVALATLPNAPKLVNPYRQQRESVGTE